MKRLLLLALLACLASVSSAQQPPLPLQKSTTLDSLAATVARTPTHLDTLLPAPQPLLHQPDSLVRAHTGRLDSLLHLPEAEVEKQIAAGQEKLTAPLDSLLIPDALREQANALLNKAPPASTTIPSELPTVEKLTQSVPESFPAVNTVKVRITLGQDQLTRYGQQATKITDQITNAPQMAEQWALDRPEMAELQGAPDALQEFTQQPLAYQKQLASLNDTQQLRSRLQQELLSRAQDHFAGHWPQVAQAQEELAKLKKKHVGAPGGQEVLPKKNSLSGKPLGERLVYGGSMQVLPGPPPALQAAPQLGYQISKQWLIGLSAQYRAKLHPDSRRLDTASPVFGGSLFTHHQFFRGFLMHAEGEWMSQLIDAEQDLRRRTGQAHWLLGLGKMYPLAEKWRGKVVLLYNVSHRKQSLYPKPWMVRFSFHRMN